MPEHDGENDYEVGYKKPPAHTQFRKGESGNRHGRPKGSKGNRSVLRSVLEQKVTIRENGEARQVDFMEAFVRKLVEKALKGTTKDQLKLLQFIEQHAPSMFKEPVEEEKVVVTFVLPDSKTMEDYHGDCGK